MKAKVVVQPIKAQKPETVTDATVASPVLGRVVSKKRANGEKNEICWGSFCFITAFSQES